MKVVWKLIFWPLGGSSNRALTYFHPIKWIWQTAQWLVHTSNTHGIGLEFLAACQLLSVKYRHQQALPLQPAETKGALQIFTQRPLFLSFNNKNYVRMKHIFGYKKGWLKGILKTYLGVVAWVVPLTEHWPKDISRILERNRIELTPNWYTLNNDHYL